MSIQISYEPYIISCTRGNFGSPFVYIFRNVPNSILTAAIFKFKMVAGYHVDSDGTRPHINLYRAYIKLQVCRCWCCYHTMHNPT